MAPSGVRSGWDMTKFFGRPGKTLGAALILLATGAQAADPPSRAAAIAAADAAAGLPAAVEAGPVCADLPASGEKLAGDMKLAAEGHSIEFANGGGGDALVKMRHAATSKLAASFYLRTMEVVTIEGVPDGAYRIQYAFGPALGPDCKSFTWIIRARELPDVEDMKTQVIETDDQTEVKRTSLSYELSVTETANVKPVSIDAATFNAE